MTKKISVIMPAYCEALNIFPMYEALKKEIAPLAINYEFIFVNDCSPDDTLIKLKELRKIDDKVHYLSMSRNHGEQKCLMAGLHHATGDCVITMDADLQHPPEYLPLMIKKWQEGNKIIVMKRKDAGHDGLLKKLLEILFYKLLIMSSDTPILFRFSGFCLMDREALSAIKKYNDADPFLRGMIAQIGFCPLELEYEESHRLHGQSNYNLKKLLRLAFTGFTSFSDFPLYVSFYAGLTAVFLSFIYLIFSIWNYFARGSDAPGWVSTIGIVIFLGGVQLICTGILGIYISKIFIQTKNRPLFITAENTLSK